MPGVHAGNQKNSRFVMVLTRAQGSSPKLPVQKKKRPLHGVAVNTQRTRLSVTVLIPGLVLKPVEKVAEEVIA